MTKRLITDYLVCGLILALVVLGMSWAEQTLAAEYTYTLEIVPPTQYTDGTALDPATDLQEYRIYETGSGSLAMGDITPGPGPVTVSFTLADGDCNALAATAVSTDGLESELSNVVRKCVRIPAAPTIEAGPLLSG